jgi:tRNA threonylcarbamoyladenosine biosynthesis protein TsaB
MRQISIDSSTSVLGIAAAESDSIVHLVEAEGAFRHVEEIVPRIDALLRECAWPAGSVDTVSVAAGPGSFTGLRIGAAAAKALSLAWDAPISFVDTLEAFALTETLLRDRPGTRQAPAEPSPTWIVPTLDARKGRYYTAVFSRGADGMPTRVTPDADLTPDEFARLIGAEGLSRNTWCAPGPLSAVIARELAGITAMADGGSAVRGVAAKGWQEFRGRDGRDVRDVARDEYRGPFYLRSGDIGIRKSAPRFEEE